MEAAERLRPVREPPVGRAADSPVLRSRENFERPLANHIVNSPKTDRNHRNNNYQASREARNNLTNSENKSHNAQRITRSTTPKEEIVARARIKNKSRIVDQGQRGEGVGEGRPRGEGSTGKESTPEPVPRRNAHLRNEKKVDKNWEEM